MEAFQEFISRWQEKVTTIILDRGSTIYFLRNELVEKLTYFDEPWCTIGNIASGNMVENLVHIKRYF